MKKIKTKNLAKCLLKGAASVSFFSLFVCGNAFSQTKSFESLTVTQIDKIDSVKLKKQLTFHKNKFYKGWEKANKPLGTDSIKSILNATKFFYVLMYDTVKNKRQHNDIVAFKKSRQRHFICV